MRTALGLAVVCAALAGGCAGGGGDRPGGDAARVEEAAGTDGQGSYPTACPTADDVGGRVGIALELEHNGFVLGDAELLCSYEDGEGRVWSASRSRNEDVEQARVEFDNGVLPDGDAPGSEEDRWRSRDLDLGDEAFVDSFADPTDAGGYEIFGRARVRVGVRVCNFEGAVDAPGTAPPAPFEDAAVHVVSTLCGLGEAPSGADETPASGDPAAGTGCPAAADLGDRLGQDVGLEGVDDDVLMSFFCTYDGPGDGVFTGVRAMWFDEYDPVGAAGRYEFDTVDADDSPERREGVTTTPLDLGDAAQLDVTAYEDDDGGYNITALAAVLVGSRVCEAEATGTSGEATLAPAAADALVWLITALCGL